MAYDTDVFPPKRTAPRIRVRFRSVEDLVTTYSNDVSYGSLYVTASRQLPIDTEVELSLELPDGQAPLTFPARVAYVLDAESGRARGRAPGMGMALVDADANALAVRIAAYLAATLESTSPAVELPLHVLVIDDSGAYRDNIASTLRAGGHRVTVAENGLVGLGKAIETPPDLILSDVNMPVMDGWHLLRLLRARASTRHIPIAFLTSLGSDEDRLRGYENGVDDYIPKPFTREDLLARVRRVVARANERSERAEQPSVPSMTGDLRQVSIASLLAFIDAERRSGVLVLRSVAGETRLSIANGKVVHVALPGGNPPPALVDRVLQVLDTLDGRFELRPGDVPAGKDEVSIPHALLEHARRFDERES